MSDRPRSGTDGAQCSLPLGGPMPGAREETVGRSAERSASSGPGDADVRVSETGGLAVSEAGPDESAKKRSPEDATPQGGEDAPGAGEAPAPLPVVRGEGLLFVADPHLADTPPGHRLPGYREQILDKLSLCLQEASRRSLVPVFLGDLFHWPRDNSNALLVALMELFRPWRPFVLVGNHDKHLARFTRDVSLAVLQEAGVIRLMGRSGPQFVLETPEGRLLVGATPDGERLPTGFMPAPGDPETVLWCTHHNIAFPDFLDRAGRIKELPGIHWLVNGHIHRPQPTVRAGATTWANPGNVTRLTFSRRSLEREPAAAIWTPGCEDLERWPIPHRDFYEVFPRQEFPPEEEERQGESRFLAGLERLAWRRSREGTGLRDFLNANLNPERPETGLIWQLYEEVVRHERD